MYLSFLDSFLNVYSKIQLVLIGAFNENIMNIIPDKIKSKITLMGLLPNDMLRYWYRVTDIAVIPSYYEQCSYSCIEMMMYGLPIVASDGFGVKSMFNEHNAIIAKIHKDTNQYAINISESIFFFINKKKRVKMGAKSRENYKNKYEISYMIKGYTNLIHSL